jgi:hypothetical protein
MRDYASCHELRQCRTWNPLHDADALQADRKFVRLVRRYQPAIDPIEERYSPIPLFNSRHGITDHPHESWRTEFAGALTTPTHGHQQIARSIEHTDTTVIIVKNVYVAGGVYEH